MANAEQLERCPQCWYDRYSYDPFCRIWCCDQCHATETVEEKRERDARGDALSASAQDAAAVPWVNER